MRVCVPRQPPTLRHAPKSQQRSSSDLDDLVLVSGEDALHEVAVGIGGLRCEGELGQAAVINIKYGCHAEQVQIRRCAYKSPCWRA